MIGCDMDICILDLEIEVITWYREDCMKSSDAS
jgi:hypothetical protein